MALAPLASQFSKHVEDLSAKCRIAAEKNERAFDVDVGMQQLVREVIAASYIANLLSRSQSQPSTTARLPALSRVPEVPDENSSCENTEEIQLPQLTPVHDTRARSGSASSISSTSTVDDELLSPAPDRKIELGWELDRAIGCGDLPYIEGLLEETRRLGLSNDTKIARPLVALEGYARRLRLLCRGSLEQRNNRFDRV